MTGPTRGWLLGLLLAAVAAAAQAAAEATPGHLPLRLYVAPPDARGTPPLPAYTSAECGPALALPLAFPGEAECRFVAPTSSWVHLAALELEVALPPGAPTNTQALVFMQDWDYWWYQNLLPGYLQPGVTNRLCVDLAPTAAGWEPVNHHGNWHLRALMEPKLFGLRLFSATPYTGTATVGHAAGVPAAPDPTLPWIRNVRAATHTVPSFGRFELTFDLPDRYPDPFDTNQVSVVAEFQTPDQRTITIPGFYSRLYYRETDTAGDRVLPQGPPRWQVRFTPLVPGVYRYGLRVDDARGSARWGPATFEATAPVGHGFVRVAPSDPRYFEHTDGTGFFPIGHNIRSPSDTRMEGVFPWALRWPEGSSVYTRYFRSMAAHGENVTEVWMAAWSLGLEWTPKWAGYHGVGQFNLMNAWELDQVMQEAARNNIHVNLVVHNHGKFGMLDDSEWKENPFWTGNGGYLEKPDEYFTNPRAQESFRKLMRYTVARWGYSPHVFAWELWSELDLTGSEHGSYRRPEVTEWHRLMGRYLKEIDPYDHMVSTHVCTDYSRQHDPIIALPEIDLAGVDAYYFSAQASQIVPLLRATAQYNNRFGKPVFVTEFGGSAFAQGYRHLVSCLHAGLWASTGTAVGGAPMFWWWGLIDEENLYPQFQALRRFMQGEDRRAPDMLMADAAVLLADAPAPDLGVQCLRSPLKATGWIHRIAAFEYTDPLTGPAVSNVVLRVGGLTNGLFQAEFWDTQVGKPIRTENAQVEADGVLDVQVPPFTRDIAFKLRRKGK